MTLPMNSRAAQYKARETRSRNKRVIGLLLKAGNAKTPERAMGLVFKAFLAAQPSDRLGKTPNILLTIKPEKIDEIV